MRGKKAHPLVSSTRASHARLPQAVHRPMSDFEDDAIVQQLEMLTLDKTAEVESTKPIRLRVLQDTKRFKEYLLNSTPIPDDLISTADYPSRDIYLQVVNYQWEVNEQGNGDELVLDLLVDRKFLLKSLTDENKNRPGVEAILSILNAAKLLSRIGRPTPEYRTAYNALCDWLGK